MEDTDKKKTIERLLKTRAGIYGREYCERCGEAKSFSGFGGAMATHTAQGRFVCWACSQGSSSRDLDALILERGFRFCANCGREVPLERRTEEEVRQKGWTCAECELPDIGLAARRRYLEHKAGEDGGLEAAVARVRWAEAGLKEIIGD